MASFDVDVVVVGAGIAGLTAAYTLLQRDPGLCVAVIEANGIASVVAVHVVFILYLFKSDVNSWTVVLIKVSC